MNIYDENNLDFFILDSDKNVVPANMKQWGEFKQKLDNKIIKQDHAGGYFVSTVFLGIEHGFINDKPLIFETMIFPGENDFDERYCTYKEALEGHERVCKMVENGELPC